MQLHLYISTHRTNNMVESFHSKFLKQIHTRHSSLWKFLDYLKAEEKDNNTAITQLEGGQTVKFPGRQADIKNEEIVKKNCCFLRNI